MEERNTDDMNRLTKIENNNSCYIMFGDVTVNNV